MQDRYVADVGDFGKYGLLRTLANPGDSGEQLRLAVLWYLVPNESHNNDGRHIAYLETGPKGVFDGCDPALFDALRGVAREDRVIRSVERSGVLPTGTLFHSVPLRYERSETAAIRRSKREDWFQAAAAVAARAELVFLDPDNGLECKVGRYTKNGPKYAYYSDAASLCVPSRSLVIYHHLSRQGTAVEQVQYRAQVLADIVPRTHRIAAVRFRRGSARVFFLAVSSTHQRYLAERLRRFLSSRWSQHFVRDPLPALGVRAL